MRAAFLLAQLMLTGCAAPTGAPYRVIDVTNAGHHSGQSGS